jgi:hypothetical protein
MAPTLSHLFPFLHRLVAMGSSQRPREQNERGLGSFDAAVCTITPERAITGLNTTKWR